jgi:hypothetical protein
LSLSSDMDERFTSLYYAKSEVCKSQLDGV